jgi:hypothetical protein
MYRFQALVLFALVSAGVPSIYSVLRARIEE